MADDEDLKLLLSGGSDLVRAVLDQADLSGMDLAGRDFSHANLRGVRFRKTRLDASILRSANMLNADFSEASLVSILGDRTVFHSVKFSNCDFMQANLSRSHFTKCDFSGANLSSSNFAEAVVNEGCNFDGVIVNHETNFEGLQISRPLARFPAFNNYILERGRLHKHGKVEVNQPRVAEVDVAIEVLGAVISQLRRIPAGSSPLFGHNQPPEEFLLTESEKTEAIEVIASAREALAEQRATTEMLGAAIQNMRVLGEKVIRYVAVQSDILVTEFAKSAGATLGSKTGLAIVALTLTDGLARAIDAVTVAGRILSLLS